MSIRETILELRERIGKAIVGQEHVVERLLIGLLANGNLLLEGLPGLAKARAVKSLVMDLDAELSRIQFTPDLLTSDITGTEVYIRLAGRLSSASSPVRCSRTWSGLTAHDVVSEIVKEVAVA